MKSESKILLFFAGGAVLVWVLGAVVDSYFMSNGPFIPPFAGAPGPAVWNRIAALAVLIVCGFIVSRYTRRLEQSERAVRHLAAIVENSGDAIITADLDGVVQSWNRGAEKVYGYAEKDMIGKGLFLVYPQDRDEEYCTMMQRLRNGEHIESFESTRTRKDGTLIHVSMGISSVPDKSGKPAWISIISRDITPRVMMEHNIRLMSREHDRFMRHELKNLFGPIRGYAELLSLTDKGKLEPNQAQYIERIIEGVDRAIGLVDYLKKIQDIEAGQYDLDRVRCPLGKIVRTAIDDLSMLADKNGVTVDYRCAGEMEGWFDLNLAPGVFLNLIKNSIEHVSRLDNPREKVVRVVQERVDNRCTVKINNQGKPLSPEKLATFFEKFNTDRKEKTDGTGLGTTYAYLVTRAHGGHITVSSNEREGTTVTLAFECPGTAGATG